MMKEEDPKEWVKVQKGTTQSSWFITEVNNIVSKYNGPKLDGKVPRIYASNKDEVDGDEDSDSDGMNVKVRQDYIIL